MIKLNRLDNKMVLSEIVFNNSGLNELLAEHPVLFEYVANLSGGLLLKKYDNGRYIRTIEYLNNSDKISGYSFLLVEIHILQHMNMVCTITFLFFQKVIMQKIICMKC